MSADPMVTFAVTLTVTEDGEALAGQGVVYVAGEAMQTLRLDREHLEVHAAIALQHALDACRDWLKIQAATKELRTPPTQPQLVVAPVDQVRNTVRVSGKPKSRRRIVSKRLPT